MQNSFTDLDSISSPNSLRNRFAENGYVIVKRAFDKEQLASLARTLEFLLQMLGSDPLESKSLNELILKSEAQSHDIVYQSAQGVGSSAATYQLLGGSKIFDLVCELTGFDKSKLHAMPLYLIVQLPSDERFDYTWHQDGSYYPWAHDFLTLWFPVNRSATKNAGTISIIPGSHRSGRRETENFLKHGFFKQMQSKLDRDETDREEVLEMELGDCCVMHGDAVHRSVANRSDSPRVAAVLRIVNLATVESYERDKFYCSHKS